MADPLHILLVDDDRRFREVQKQLLLRAGYRVTTADNGNDAIRMLEDPQDVTVAVIDLIMPVREGLETIPEIRRRWPEIRIVAISGGGRINPADYLQVAHMLGADRALAKPYRFAQLESVILELTDSPGES